MAAAISTWFKRWWGEHDSTRRGLVEIEVVITYTIRAWFLAVLLALQSCSAIPQSGVAAPANIDGQAKTKAG